MNDQKLGDRLLELILLLVGLEVFNATLIAIAPILDLDEWLIPFVENSYWLGKFIFGITIYRLTKQNYEVSVPIGILSTVLPIFGGLFYLLTFTENTGSK